jgi:hypothetical protein
MGRRRQFIAAALFVVALATGLWLAARGSPAQTWLLPDGSTLRLVKVTWGTNHICRYGNRLIDYLHPFVPGKYRSRFRFQVAALGTGAPRDMVVWLQQQNSTNRPTQLGQLGFGAFYTPLFLNVVHEHGVASGDLQSIPRRMAAGNHGAATLFAAPLSSHPRWGGGASVRIYWRSDVGRHLDYTYVGQFSVPGRISRICRPGGQRRCLRQDVSMTWR